MSEDLIGFVNFGGGDGAAFFVSAPANTHDVALAPITSGGQTTGAEFRRPRMNTSFVAYRRVRLYMITGLTFICEVPVHLRANGTKQHRRIHSSLRCS